MVGGGRLRGRPPFLIRSDMAEIPQEKLVAQRIYAAWKEHRPVEMRPHLGASLIGEDCPRRLWYTFRWAAQGDPDGRMRRLWDRGDREEPVFLQELRAIGCEVHDLDPSTGRQYRVRWLGGHFSHGADGVACGIPGGGDQWHLLEFKTAKAERWRELARHGLRKAEPRYWAQCQVGMLGHGLERCLFLSSCKDDDQIFEERFALDRPFAESMVDRAERIVTSPGAPPRLTNDATNWKCKFCDFQDTCHRSKPALVNCRTCEHARVLLDGTDGDWACALDGRILTLNEQRAGCPKHAYLDDMLPF